MVDHALRNTFYLMAVDWKGKRIKGNNVPLIPLEPFNVHACVWGRGMLPLRLTAEREKGKYTQNHFTGRRGPCTKPRVIGPIGVKEPN